jgi:hypothetical protein
MASSGHRSISFNDAAMIYELELYAGAKVMSLAPYGSSTSRRYDKRKL